MPDAQQLFLFIVAGVLLNLTPGADVLYIVSHAIRRGARAGVVGALGVSGAAEETSLEAIRRLFAERGIGSSAAQGGAEVLGLLGSGFALLHARREKSSPGGKAEVVGHYLVVDDYDPVTGTLRVYDPPVLPYRSLLREVLKPWSGHALLFGDAERALSRRNRGLTAAGGKACERVTYVWQHSPLSSRAHSGKDASTAKLVPRMP